MYTKFIQIYSTKPTTTETYFVIPNIYYLRYFHVWIVINDIKYFTFGLS